MEYLKHYPSFRRRIRKIGRRENECAEPRLDSAECGDYHAEIHNAVYHLSLHLLSLSLFLLSCPVSQRSNHTKSFFFSQPLFFFFFLFASLRVDKRYKKARKEGGRRCNGSLINLV